MVLKVIGILPLPPPKMVESEVMVTHICKFVKTYIQIFPVTLMVVPTSIRRTVTVIYLIEQSSMCYNKLMYHRRPNERTFEND